MSTYCSFFIMLNNLFNTPVPSPSNTTQELETCFPINVTLVIMAKHFFHFHQTTTHLPKSNVFVPKCICRLVPVLSCSFWINRLFLFNWPFSPCEMDNDALLAASSSIFIMSFGFVVDWLEDYAPKEISKSLEDRTHLLGYVTAGHPHCVYYTYS